MPFLVCCVFAYWLVKHIPQLAGDAVSEWQHARRGEESPAAAARRMRLQDAGVDPASGGAFRQYAGNAWRDFWLDKDRDRTARRSAPGGRTASGGRTRLGLFARLVRAFDAEVERRSQAWRARREQAGEQQPRPEAPIDGAPGPQPTGGPDDAPAAQPEPDTEPDTAQPDPETASPVDEPAPPRPARRVTSTVGEPITDPTPSTTAVAVLDRPAPTSTAPSSPTERTPDMSSAVATNQTAVTGVVSGAAEARAIVRYLEQATEAYEAAMAQARKRIHSLGEQTVGVVQMATKSTVVDATAQAAESIAAAQAGASRCKAETIPLLGRVAREFDKRNS